MAYLIAGHKPRELSGETAAARGTFALWSGTGNLFSQADDDWQFDTAKPSQIMNLLREINQ